MTREKLEQESSNSVQNLSRANDDLHEDDYNNMQMTLNSEQLKEMIANDQIHEQESSDK